MYHMYVFAAVSMQLLPVAANINSTFLTKISPPSTKGRLQSPKCQHPSLKGHRYRHTKWLIDSRKHLFSMK